MKTLFFHSYSLGEVNGSILCFFRCSDTYKKQAKIVYYKEYRDINLQSLCLKTKGFELNHLNSSVLP